MTFAVLCAAGIVSLLAVGTAVLLVYSFTDTRLDDASLFGILVAALCLPLTIHGRAKRRRKELIRNARLTYEQSYSGERTLLIDDKGWILQTTSGHQQANWASKFGCTAFKNTIIVACADQQPLIVPNRIFSAEELHSFQTYAIGENHGFISRLRVSDYILSMMPTLWRRHWVAMAVWHAFGLLIFWFLLLHVNQTTELAASFGRSISVGLLLVVIALPPCYLVLEYEQSGRFGDRWQVQASEAGLVIQTRDWESFSSWRIFDRIAEGSRCFILDVGVSAPYLISKNCAPPEQQREFRRRIDSRASTPETQTARG